MFSDGRNTDKIIILSFNIFQEFGNNIKLHALLQGSYMYSEFYCAIVCKIDCYSVLEICHCTTFVFMQTGAPNENIVQNHLNITLLNVF